MDIEASIAERLEKLRQWQIEQQERLLKQQQMQREVLSNEQNRICKALGLTIHDLSDIIENTENVTHGIKTDGTETIFDEEASDFQCNAKNLDNALKMIDKEVSTQNANALYESCKEEEAKDSDISAIVDKNRNSVKRYNSGILSPDKELNANLLIEGIKPLSLDNAVSNSCIPIDDIPLPSPKKDFQTLLEEKLKRESEATSNACADAKPKRPFLKKGQGLSRFKTSENSKQPTTTRKCSMSSTPKQCIDKSDKCRKSTVVSKSPNNFVTGGKRQLSLKSVPLPRNKIVGKSGFVTPSKQAASDRTRYTQENTSDSDSKMDRELEEMRIFELMEEKAKNSSFCSTSSTVLAFLQQSSPFKIKKGLNSTGEDDVESTSQRSAHVENSKPRIQHQLEQLSIHKQSRISATVDPHLNTVPVNDAQERKHSTNAEEVSQSDKVHIDCLENHDLDIITASSSSSDSDEEADTSKGNNLARDSESSDANHRVRFSEYNEYRTIDITDAADQSFRDSLEQQDWNDETSELSDVEERFVPLNYEKQMSSLKVTSDEETIDVSRRLFLREHITKDTYYRLTKADEEENEEEMKNIYEDDECTIIEEIVETSDEEEQQSILSSSSSSSSDVQRKKYILKSEPEKKLIMEKIAKIHSNAKDIDSYPSEDRINRTNDTRTFEPELLKSRLLELEKEIDIFRKESAALLLQRRNLQEEQTSLRKDYAEKERNFEENRRRVENRLEEERKRLARERIAMENRVRDAQEKAKQNKTERQKAQDLQEQLDKLREELSVRESRWTAAESRYKSELRVLRAEVSKLKEELASLRNVKKTNLRNTRKSGQMITKAINQINRRIVAPPSKEPPAKMMSSSDFSAPEDKDGDKSMESIVKTVYINDDLEQVDNISVDNKKVESKQVGIASSQPKCNKATKFPDESIARKKQYLYENLLKDATSDLLEDQNPSHIKRDVNNEDDIRMQNRIHEKSPSSTSCPSSLRHRTSEANTNKDVKQIQYSDGRVEHWYPNGNVKKVFPDRGITKMIYYNGDVRETDKDGRVKYFYATTRTWHTTTPDGFEILEFPDGQVEKRASDGTIEVSFPDGAVRIAQADGTEKWSLPDGTIAETFNNGDRILTLPNGQREIHTKEHKRREYPNGTVKLVYVDGTQETRYFNGRKRLKDKDGNLLMDSYDN